MKILVLNGPNLNMLGKREPDVYGSTSLSDIEQMIHQKIDNKIDCECFQTNHEGMMLDKIHQSFGSVDYIIINPGAWTHTSVALRDALLSVNIPFVEVHISNVYKREKFRHHSFLSDIATAVISGLGVDGYLYALDFALHKIQQNNR